MHNQARSSFPEVNSQELWGNVTDHPSPRTPTISGCNNIWRGLKETPKIATPRMISPYGSDEKRSNFFKEREMAGLLTPAATPSDILYRGPLYASSSEEDSFEAFRIKSPSSPIVQNDGGVLQKKLEYHRERQAAIRASIHEYEAKMTGLLDWHRDQERILVQGDVHSSSSRSSLRRGRSKLSERLYEAIDLNGG